MVQGPSLNDIRHCPTATPDELQAVMGRGLTNYTRACNSLLHPSHLPLEAALFTSLTLFNFDWFLGRRQISFVLANAAVNLLQQLEVGSGPGRQTTIDYARAFFYDLHFPVDDPNIRHMVLAKSQQSLRRGRRAAITTVSTARETRAFIRAI